MSKLGKISRKSLIALAVIATTIALTAHVPSRAQVSLGETGLLVPFWSNTGFSTFIVISNTTKDPFGSTEEEGTCTLNFFGTNAPAPFTIPVIPAGQQSTVGIGPGFQGYVIIQCGFRHAHGFAYLQSGVNIVATIPVLVMDPTDQQRTSPRESLGQ